MTSDVHCDREEVRPGTMHTLPVRPIAGGTVSISAPFYELDNAHAWPSALYAHIRAVGLRLNKHRLCLYARTPGAPTLPCHYEGHGLTIRILVNLYPATQEGRMSIQFGPRDKTYCYIPEVVLTFSPAGTVQSTDEHDQYGHCVPAPVVVPGLGQLLLSRPIHGRFETFHEDEYVFRHSAFTLCIV